MRSITMALLFLVISPGAFAWDVVNPRFCSPNGELCLVVRQYPRVGDFDRMSSEEYWRTDPIDEWLEQYPKRDAQPSARPVSIGAALYRRWPSGNQELLSELSFPNAAPTGILVTDEGLIVTHDPIRCEKDAELLKFRAQDGSIVRTLAVRDVFTRNDQAWLCRGTYSDVRWAIQDAALHATVLVTDTKWDDPESRFATIEIELPDGDVPSPKRDLCPAALLVEIQPDDGVWQPRERIAEAADVMPIDSTTLLARAITREIPEYPLVATKARIMGSVRVRVVVDREGRVESAIVQPLPFGIDQAVKDAIVKWTFQPEPTRYSGWFVFRFRIVRNFTIVVVTSSGGTSSS